MNKDTPRIKSFFQINVKVLFFLSAILTVTVFFSIFIFVKTNFVLNKKQAEANELSRPADLEMIMLTDSSCADCFDLNNLVEIIQKGNVKINQQKIIEASTDEGQKLIKKYGITKIPAMLVTGELEKDVNVKDLWQKVGRVQDGVFVFSEQTPPPFLELESGEVKGRVKITLLTDDSCSECYDINIHKNILGGSFGMPLNDLQAVDISSAEGKKLINEYNINLVPTFIVQGDVGVYSNLLGIWPKVGTVGVDGVYVFGEGVKQMGVYKDLNTGKVVKPIQQ